MLKVPHLERMRAIGVALAAVMGSIGGAGAEAYPSRPITIVVPYAAGGLFARLRVRWPNPCASRSLNRS